MRIALGLAVALVLMAGADRALGQTIVGDNVGQNIQAPWNTATGGVQGLRAPGNVVSNARSRFNTAHDTMIVRSRQGPTITEQPGPDIQSQTTNAAVQTLLTSLNAFLAVVAQSVASGGTGGAGGGGGQAMDPAVAQGLMNLLGSISSPV